LPIFESSRFLFHLFTAMKNLLFRPPHISSLNLNSADERRALERSVENASDRFANSSLQTPQIRAPRFPLRWKLLVFALFIVACALVIAVLGFVQQTVLTASLQASEIQTELLKAHDGKNKFMLRRSSADAETAQTLIAKALESFRAFEPGQATDALIRTVERYGDALRRLIVVVKDRGLNENSGAEGEFRRAVHEAQSIAARYQASAVEIALLQARRREKDFFMRGDDAYIGEVRQLVASALRAIESSRGLPRAVQEELSVHLTVYLRAFEAAARFSRESRILDEALNEEMEAIEPLIGAIVAARRERAAMMQQIVLGAVIFCLAASVGWAFLLAYRLSLPIAALERAARKISAGAYDVEVRSRSRDEVGNLAQAFNAMAERVRRRTRDLEEYNNELSRLNEEARRQQERLEEQTIAAQRANLELSSANAAFKKLNADLERANQEKNEILGIAAHDLKNPLMGMRGLIALLERFDGEKLTANDVKETAEILRRAVERMVTIVNNLLDINAIETGNMRLRAEPFSARAAIQETVEDYRLRAEEKGITLLLELRGGEEEEQAFGDADATRQIYDNIVSNAVKYSPSGKRIWVRASVFGAYFRVEVQDEGPGLSEEDKKKLFGKFVRLSAQPTGNEHSTGLGLSIVKRMVEAMRGKVWCEAELGKGAMFIVELPLNARRALVREKQ
jgi:signal transduction histidine kinase